MTTYLALENQSVYDLALQLYGDVDGAVKLCVDNNLALDADVEAGTPIVYDETLVYDRDTLSEIARTGLLFTTQRD